MSLRVALCLALSFFALPTSALAQRAGRVLFGLDEAPAVFLGPDRAWILEGGEAPRIVCSAVMCRPVVEVAACTAPQCPGAGLMVRASEPIADVSDFPTDREGFAEAQRLLYGEPSLAPMTPSFLPHPSPPPPPPRPAAYAYDGEFWHFELALGGGIGTGLVHISQPMWQTDATFGIRLRPNWGGSRDEGLDVIWGTELGVEVRAHVIGNITGQHETDLAVFVGLGPAFGYTEGALRIPAAFSWIVPEYGFVVRTDRVPPSWYAGWSVPVTWLLDPHLAIEARVNVLVIGEWYSDDSEVLSSLTAGFVIR